MADYDTDEDDIFQQYVDLSSYDVGDNEYDNAYRANSPQLEPECSMRNTVTRTANDLAFDNMDLDAPNAFLPASLDLSLGARNTTTTHQMMHPPPLLLDPSFDAVIASSSASRFRTIQPSPNMVPADPQSLGMTQQNRALTQGIRKELRAVRSHDRSRNSKPARLRGGFQKFRVDIPHSAERSNGNGVKKTRLKKSQAHPCLLCSYLKRKCEPGTPCSRCVEKSMGQRDLAFTRCIRESPTNFNLFWIDGPDEVTFNPQGELLDPWFYLRLIYIAHRNSKYPSRSVLQWTFSELTTQLLGITGDEQKAVPPLKLTALRMMLCQTTHHLLRHLEPINFRRYMRSSMDGLKYDYFITALTLYGFLATLEERQIPCGQSQTMDFCQRYLLEYLTMLLPGVLRAAGLEGNQMSVQNHLACMMAKAPYGPRTKLRIFTDAQRIVTKWESDIFQEQNLNSLFDRVDWSCRNPQLSDPDQLKRVWALFWRAIPTHLLSSWDFKHHDFLGPLLVYGNASPAAKVKGKIATGSWADWDARASIFGQMLQNMLVMIKEYGPVSETDTLALIQLYVMWRIPSNILRNPINESNSLEVSYALRSCFRLTVIGFLVQEGGLIGTDGWRSFIDDIANPASALRLERFGLGFQLFTIVATKASQMLKGDTKLYR